MTLFCLLGEEVVLHSEEEKVWVHDEDKGSGNGRHLVAEAVQEGADEKKNLVDGAVVFFVEHAAYTIVGEKVVERLLFAGRGEVGAEAGGGEPLSNSGKDDAGELEDAGADGKERTLGVGRARTGEERF